MEEFGLVLNNILEWSANERKVALWEGARRAHSRTVPNLAWPNPKKRKSTVVAANTHPAAHTPSEKGKSIDARATAVAKISRHVENAMDP